MNKYLYITEDGTETHQTNDFPTKNDLEVIQRCDMKVIKYDKENDTFMELGSDGIFRDVEKR